MTRLDRPEWAARLQMERESREWGKWQTARRLLDAKGEVEPSTEQVKSVARQITTHERGKVYPAEWGILYATIYGIPHNRLFPDPPPVEQLAGIGSRGTVDTTGAPEDWDDMERRALLQLLAVLGSGAAVPAAALETLRSGLDQELSVRDGFSVEDWEETVADHAYSIRVIAPTALVGLLSADVVDVRNALAHRPELDRASMQRVSAQLAALMAMALEELNASLAARWWRTSQHSAAKSGDKSLEVYIHGRRARAASDRPDALQRADQAIQLAGGRPSAGLAEAYATRAVVLARTGDHAGARQALRDLGELYVRLPAETAGERAAIWGWPRERYVYERTSVRLSLGDPDLYGELPKRGVSTLGIRSQVHGDLKTAWARINTGEVNEGLADAAEAASALPPEHRTLSIRGIAGEMYTSLPDEKVRALPAARELRVLTAGT